MTTPAMDRFHRAQDALTALLVRSNRYQKAAEELLGALRENAALLDLLATQPMSTTEDRLRQVASLCKAAAVAKTKIAEAEFELLKARAIYNPE